MRFVWLLIVAILINGSLGYSWWTSDDTNKKNADETNLNSKLKRASNDNEDEDVDYDSDNGNDNNGNGDNGGSDDDAGGGGGDDNAYSTTENTPATHEPPRYSDPRLRQPQPQQASAQCNRQQYRCHYSGICVDSSLVCNGQTDCLHGDDERDCATIAQSNSQCASQEFQCQGTPIRCINTASVCDGTYHCQYGDDEANCNDRNMQDIRANQPQIRPSIPERTHPPPQPVTTEESRVSVPERDPQPRPQPRPTYNEETQSRPNTQDRDASRQQPRPTNTDANSSKDRRLSDDYIQRLEWRDRCVRSCLRY